MDDIVIKVENLSKQYRLGVIGHGSLSQDLQSWWALFRGKEDPNLKVGLASNSQDPFSDERFWALKDISFDVRKGEILGIIGRNGAGKSTLLKILSRVTAPTTGSVKIKGRVASLLEVGTGFHPELTGRENVFLNGAILGMTKSEIESKFDEIVHFAEIDKFIDTPVKRYSSGMYIRLAFAVSAHLEPEILIVDEVLAVGDASFQKKCLGKMSEVAGEGRTVLFVSHNMNAVKAMCSRIIYLENGIVINDGIPEKVISSYFSTLFNMDVSLSDSSFKRNSDLSLIAKFNKISVYNDKLEGTNIVDSKKPFTVEFTLEVKSPLTFSLVLWISDIFDKRILLFNSGRLQHKLFSLNNGNYKVRCNINPTYLTSGEYFIGCGITIGDCEWIDLINYAYRLNVMDLDPYNTGINLDQKSAVFCVNHDWVVINE